MKTIKAAAAAVVAMAMFSGVAHADLFKSIKGGFSKAVKVVKQAPSKTVEALKTGWKSYNDATTKYVGDPLTKAFNDSVQGLKTGWKAYNGATTKYIGDPLTQGFNATVNGVKTAWKKTSGAGGSVVRGGKKVVSKIKKLFRR